VGQVAPQPRRRLRHTVESAAIQRWRAARGGPDYRARLLGVPRTIWTLDALLAQILDVDGVRDAAVFDPLRGVDVSQSYFNMFLFGQRAFSLERQIGSPYCFDIVVAVEPGWPWTTAGGSIPGVYDTVARNGARVAAVSIFPNILEANDVNVGVRATLVVQAGHDQDAVKGQILENHGLARAGTAWKSWRAFDRRPDQALTIFARMPTVCPR